MFGMKKRKCYFCGDKHKRTKKYALKVGEETFYVCNMCGMLRGFWTTPRKER